MITVKKMKNERYIPKQMETGEIMTSRLKQQNPLSNEVKIIQ